MVTIFFVDSAAFGTTLRGILSRYLQNFGTIFMSLIGQELLQLIERPAAQVVILFRSFGKIGRFEANTGQIFKRKQRIFAVFFNECLRNLMVYIRHPTVLSSRNGFESTLC